MVNSRFPGWRVSSPIICLRHDTLLHGFNYFIVFQFNLIKVASSPLTLQFFFPDIC